MLIWSKIGLIPINTVYNIVILASIVKKYNERFGFQYDQYVKI